MRTRALGAVAAASALAGALIVACSSPSLPTPDDPVLARGQEVYDSRCAQCHGRSGGGSGAGPKLAGVVAARLTYDEHVRIVTEGGGGGMPSFGDRLDDADIEAVVRYEREVL